MLKRIEDITIVTAEEFDSNDGDMIFVDTVCEGFKSQPLAQAYLAVGESESELPSMWQEANVFGGGVLLTYEPGVIHTFLSPELKDELESGKFLFVKVIAIGE